MLDFTRQFDVLETLLANVTGSQQTLTLQTQAGIQANDCLAYNSGSNDALIVFYNSATTAPTLSASPTSQGAQGGSFLSQKAFIIPHGALVDIQKSIGTDKVTFIALASTTTLYLMCGNGA